MHQYSIVLLSLFYLQAVSTGYGGWVAPVFAGAATLFTIWSQIKQKRLETEIQTAHLKSDATKEVVDQWKGMFTNQREELRDIRRRLRGAEAHTRICERGQMKLVAQLIKAGVEVDLQKILDDMNQAENLFLENELSEKDRDETAAPNKTKDKGD